MNFLRPALALLLALSVGPAVAKESPATAVPGVSEAQLSAGYWIARLPSPDKPLLSPAQVATQNRRLFAEDRSMNALDSLPAAIDAGEVAERIRRVSRLPSRPLFFADGRPVDAAWTRARLDSLDLGSLPAKQPLRFALVVRRASLRTFPDTTRVFTDLEDHDIDRFQESALFVGTPVAIVHASRDGRWRFVLAPNYAAWIQADALAEGSRAEVLGYAARQPARVVLGARADTVFTPEEPRVSELRMEMGQRLPLADVSAAQAVNGQHPFTAWPILLPVRDADGRLGFAPALLPRTADTGSTPLPLTRANLLRQAFKLLGERYGWGHDYNARDCSGFVAEVYRSLGVELPRNTGDQSKSPVLGNRSVFGPGEDRAARERALAATQPGDLLFIPGHLMMVVGHVDGKLYVIHDIEGGTVLDAEDKPRKLHLNGVSVTPFAPLRFDEFSDFTDELTTILRIP
jgi:cell wall-associated NlpC family hydrolase